MSNATSALAATDGLRPARLTIPIVRWTRGRTIGHGPELLQLADADVHNKN